MRKAILGLVVIGLAVAVAVVVAQEQANTLPSPTRLEEGIGPGVDASEILGSEWLWQGDMTAEMGLGCSNSTGNSGGPNDIAVALFPTIVPHPQIGITRNTYNIFSQNGYVTQLAFAAWTGNCLVGRTIGTQALTAGQMSVGTHTVAISPAIWPVASSGFMAGHIQAQSAAGMRWGLDTSSGSMGNSFIRAPGCGLAGWGTLDSIGFPGNWVMRVVVWTPSPVELQTYTAEWKGPPLILFCDGFGSGDTSCWSYTEP